MSADINVYTGQLQTIPSVLYQGSIDGSGYGVFATYPLRVTLNPLSASFYGNFLADGQGFVPVGYFNVSNKNIDGTESTPCILFGDDYTSGNVLYRAGARLAWETRTLTGNKAGRFQVTTTSGAGVWQGGILIEEYGNIIYNGNQQINFGTTSPARAKNDFYGAVYISPETSVKVPLTLIGLTSQSTNYLEIKNSANTTLFAVNTAGQIQISNVANLQASLGAGGLGYTPLNPANNLSDVASISTSRTNLGLGTAAVQNIAYFLQAANNLSDVVAATARTNLAVYSSAQVDTIAAGKEPTITAGTTLQYIRGDKSLGTHDTLSVVENTNLYFTNARVLAAILTGLVTSTAGTILATDTLLVALGKLQNTSNGKEPTITAGTTSQYIRGDKSLSTFLTDVMASLLTGLVTSTSGAIVAADNLLAALGKLQNQISTNTTSIATKEPAITAGTTAQYLKGDKSLGTLDTVAVVESTNLYFTNARAIASTLTSFAASAYSAVTSSDTVLTAIQKLYYWVSSVFPSQTSNSGKFLTTDGTNLSWASISATVLAVVLAGLSTATNSAITSSDTVLSAFGKLQAQITANITAIAGKASLSTANVFSGGTQSTTSATLAISSGVVTVAASTANSFNLSLTANVTNFTATGLVQDASYIFRIKQDATGGRTVTWDTAVFKFGTLSSTVASAANAVTLVTGRCWDGTTIEVVLTQGGW